MLQRVIFGEVKMRENAELEDLNAREKWALVPLVAMAIVMGVAPMLFLRVSEKSVSDVRQSVVGAGEKSVTLRGENIAADFVAIIDDYVAKKYLRENA